MAQNQFIETTLQYSDVPWYRRRGFVILLLLLFAPAVILVGTTGNIYADVEGKVCVVPNVSKRAIMIAACALSLVGLKYVLLG